jgi:hypothetical protein
MNTINSSLAFQDIIDERLTKTKAILSCLLTAWDNCSTLDRDTIYNTLWSIDDYLQEIIESRAALTELKREKTEH